MANVREPNTTETREHYTRHGYRRLETDMSIGSHGNTELRNESMESFPCPVLCVVCSVLCVCVSNRYCRHVGKGGGPALASVSMGVKVILIAEYLQVTLLPYRRKPPDNHHNICMNVCYVIDRYVYVSMYARKGSSDLVV